MSYTNSPAGAAPIRAPAQGQEDSHLQAAQMAHAAATRSAVARVLAGNGTSSKSPGMSMTIKPPGANSFKHHVMAIGGPGTTPAHVHAAIGAAAAAGHFSPQQAAQLQAHDGPLMGPAGAQTIATLGATVKHMKAPTNV